MPNNLIPYGFPLLKCRWHALNCIKENEKIMKKTSKPDLLIAASIPHLTALLPELTLAKTRHRSFLEVVGTHLSYPESEKRHLSVAPAFYVCLYELLNAVVDLMNDTQSKDPRNPPEMKRPSPQFSSQNL